MEQKVAEFLRQGICPNCHGKSIEITPDYINCKSEGCSLHGNPAFMKWCEKVPVYDVLTKDGPATIKSLEGTQIYEYHGTHYLLAGYVEGCGRYVSGDYCTHCQGIFPKIFTQLPTAGKRRRAGNAVRD